MPWGVSSLVLSDRLHSGIEILKRTCSGGGVLVGMRDDQSTSRYFGLAYSFKGFLKKNFFTFFKIQ